MLNGHGPDILLLRPFGGSMLLWDKFGEELASHARVIAFDPRGTGESAAGTFPLTTRGMARDALALIEALGIGQVHVFGLSLGGMVASWLAIDAPGRVKRLVLASTLARGIELKGGSILKGVSYARCLLRTAREAESCLVSRTLSSQFREAHPEEFKRIKALAHKPPASKLWLLSALAAMAAHDVRKLLDMIKAKTLVLLGELDPFLSRESQEELVELIPDAELRTVQGAAHDLSLEAPRETAELVLDHFGLNSL